MASGRSSGPRRRALERSVLDDQEAVERAELREHLDEVLALDVTLLQLKVLLLLVAEGPSTGQQLVARLGTGAPTVSGLVDRLVERGLVVRSPASADRRVTVLEPAPAGVAAVDVLRRALRARTTAVVARLDDDALEHLALGLAAVRRALEAG